MSDNINKGKYYIIAAENPERMLLSYLPKPTDNPFKDGWRFGKRFLSAPKEPVVVTIVAGHEKRELMPYYDAEPIMSNSFYQALVDAGVDNMDAYEAVLQSEDGTVEYKGFKAVNIIGVIKATGEKTQFTGDSRLIDAGMDGVEIDSGKASGALMFRLAENLSTVIVHERVKRFIESKGFASVVFRDPGETLVLG